MYWTTPVSCCTGELNYSVQTKYWLILLAVGEFNCSVVFIIIVWQHTLLRVQFLESITLNLDLRLPDLEKWGIAKIEVLSFINFEDAALPHIVQICSKLFENRRRKVDSISFTFSSLVQQEAKMVEKLFARVAAADPNCRSTWARESVEIMRSVVGTLARSTRRVVTASIKL